MKTVLMLADSPEGTIAVLKWDSNGHQDHLQSSIAMNTMANCVKLIETLEKAGGLKVIRPADD